MLAMIKKQFSIQWRDWILMLAFEAGAFLFGFILFSVIMRFSDESTYFAMGTVMGAMMALIFSVVQSLSGMQIYFNVEISMGMTRKQFLVSYLMTCFCANILNMVLLVGLNALENTLLRTIYAGLTEEINFLPYLIRWAFPAAVLLAVYGGFCGTLLLRFGRKAFWIMWVLWMFGCLGIPKISDAVTENPESVYGKIGVFLGDVLRGISPNVWITAACVLGIGAFAGMWIILRKQEVRA